MRVNRNSLSFVILDLLEKSADSYVRLEDFTYKSSLYAYGDRWNQLLPKSTISKALSRLKKGGCIQEGRINDQLIWKLTQTGRDLVSDFEGREVDNWDGKWRVVIFDVPEEKRVVRNLFRRNLKKWGFKYYQKSVWISKKDIFDKLNGYIKELGIEKWVTVMEADKISLPKT